MAKSEDTTRKAPLANTRQPGSSVANLPLRRAPSSEIVDGGSDTEIAAFSQRQESALPVVALFPSIAQASRASGVGKSTLYRWLQDPDFRAEVARIRQEYAELARQELQGLSLRGAAVINDALNDPNPAIRLRAANYALSHSARLSEIRQVGQDLQELKDALALRSSR